MGTVSNKLKFKLKVIMTPLKICDVTDSVIKSNNEYIFQSFFLLI